MIFCLANIACLPQTLDLKCASFVMFSLDLKCASFVMFHCGTLILQALESKSVIDWCLFISNVSETEMLNYYFYSKTCLKRPLKIDKTKVLMENGSLMRVESIEEFSNTFDLF